jgi:tight adherence protein C
MLHSFFSITALVFVAVLLLLEGLYLFWKSYRGPQARNIDRRLKSLSGVNDKVQQTQLLKQQNLSDVPLFEGTLQRLPSMPCPTRRKIELDRNRSRYRRSVCQTFHAVGRLGQVVATDQLHQRRYPSSGCASDLFRCQNLVAAVVCRGAFVFLRAATQAQGLSFMMWLMLSALIGCYLPNMLLSWKIRTRKREIFENFPDAADLMLVCVKAGLGLDAGLAKVADEMKMKSEALAEELHLTNLEMRTGSTREKSLRNLALRTGVEEIGTFATMLTQADKFGTSIGESLRVFSDDLRHKRQTRAEETVAKIPTKMLFPLVVCIFPSIIMVIMGPAAIQVIRTMLPMIGKGSV